MNFYDEIKDTLIKCEVKVSVKDYTRNNIILESYYYVGKMLSEAGSHYGEGIIKEYSKKLEKEVGKKYNVRYLYDIKKLYEFSKVHPLDAQLTLSHYRILFSIKNQNEVDYYISKIKSNKLSKRELKLLIQSHEYERLPESTKNKLALKEQPNEIELIHNPILIKTNNKNVDINNIKESWLKEYILENLDYFLNELGTGFTYVGNEYKLKEDGITNRIDILLFNYILNSFVVIELKVTELKKEHIGQISYYMNYVDKNIKKKFHKKTIGIILCKEDNKLVTKYISDKRINVREFILV